MQNKASKKYTNFENVYIIKFLTKPLKFTFAVVNDENKKLKTVSRYNETITMTKPLNSERKNTIKLFDENAIALPLSHFFKYDEPAKKSHYRLANFYKIKGIAKEFQNCRIVDWNYGCFEDNNKKYIAKCYEFEEYIKIGSLKNLEEKINKKSLHNFEMKKHQEKIEKKDVASI